MTTEQNPLPKEAEKEKKYNGSLIYYFYTEVKQLYGSNFHTEFPHDSDVKKSKAKWGWHISKLTKNQVDRGLETLQREMVKNNREFTYPDISKIINLCKPRRGDVAGAREFWKADTTVIDEKAFARSQAANKEYMSKIRNSF